MQYCVILPGMGIGKYCCRNLNWIIKYRIAGTFKGKTFVNFEDNKTIHMYLSDLLVFMHLSLRVLVSAMPGRGKGGAHKVRHLKAKQQKKKFIRSKDPILSVFMWGVQHSVS